MIGRGGSKKRPIDCVHDSTTTSQFFDGDDVNNGFHIILAVNGGKGVVTITIITIDI